MEIVLPEDPRIPLLDIYPRDAPPPHKATCSTTFMAALFIIASDWKPPSCLSNENCLKKKYGISTQWTINYKDIIMKFSGNGWNLIISS